MKFLIYYQKNIKSCSKGKCVIKQMKGFSAQAYRGTLRTENPFFALYYWIFDVKPAGG